MSFCLSFLDKGYRFAILALVSALGHNYLLSYLTSTISPYLMGILILLLAISFTLCWRNWRLRKQSPYFFLRQQAEQRLQRYALLTIGLVAAMVVLSTYSLPSTQSADQSYALIRNAKPLLSNESDVEEDDGAQVVRFDESAVSIASSNVGQTETLSDEDSPEVITSAATDEHISNIAFSTEISDALDPIGASTNFGEGNYTLYATFYYEEMEEGMVWSWTWRKGDQVVGSGSEAWEYGNEGNGYIFLSPEEGFSSGEYGLEIAVEGTKVSQSSLNVSSSFAR